MVTKEEYLKQYGILPSENPTEAQLPYDSVSQMRERLELRKLQIELDKLEKPDTSVDYYSKMLELQKESFSQQMEMIKQQTDLKLEIEKLKLMGESDSDNMLPYLQMLAPLLPSIIANKNNIPQTKTKINDEDKKEGSHSPEPSINTDEKEVSEEMVAPDTAGELEAYKEEIKKGNISFEEAYKDFLTTPFANILTKEQFREKFDEIKAEPQTQKNI